MNMLNFLKKQKSSTINIVTTKELLKTEFSMTYIVEDELIITNGNDIIEKMLIDFAKSHVQAALKAASIHVKLKRIDFTVNDYMVDKESILNSYPLKNIK